jgi:hypothetical protein
VIEVASEETDGPKEPDGSEEMNEEMNSSEDESLGAE